ILSKQSSLMPIGIIPKTYTRHCTLCPSRHRSGRSGKPDVLMRASGQMTCRRRALFCTSFQTLAAEQPSSVHTSTFIGAMALFLHRLLWLRLSSVKRLSHLTNGLFKPKLGAHALDFRNGLFQPLSPRRLLEKAIRPQLTNAALTWSSA